MALSAEASQTLAMVFHELATNAAKFGAISVKSGCVSVRWSFSRIGHAESWLCIYWEERGGPIVVPPTQSGLGTCVVRELIPYELGGNVELHHPEGVRCKFEIPVYWLSSGNPPATPATSADLQTQPPADKRSCHGTTKFGFSVTGSGQQGRRPGR